MKFLGRVEDPKDLTTKEYVDNADTVLAKSVANNKEYLENLDESKLDKEDIRPFTQDEIKSLWDAYIK